VHLFHEAALAIAISVNLGVELVHETGLLVLTLVDRPTGVGVVSISPGAVLPESVGHTILDSVSAVVLSKVVVLAAVVVARSEASTLTARAGRTAAARLMVAKTSGIVTVTGSAFVVAVTRLTTNQVVVVVSRSLANSTKATSCASTNVLRNTLEGVVSLFAAGQSSTLVLKLIHGHGRKGCGAVVCSLVVVNLVNRNGGVNNVRLDSLLLDDRLDGLVDVVVDVLTTNGSSGTLAVCGTIYPALILEASLLLDQVPLNGVVVAVVELAVLNSAELGCVLLGKDFAVLNGLNGAVVVVLVNLLVDRSLNLLVHMGLDDLVLNSRGDGLVDSGVVVSRLGHEVSDSCLSLVHCEAFCC
jgi:hypothetical protein